MKPEDDHLRALRMAMEASRAAFLLGEARNVLEEVKQLHLDAIDTARASGLGKDALFARRCGEAQQRAEALVRRSAAGARLKAQESEGALLVVRRADLVAAPRRRRIH